MSKTFRVISNDQQKPFRIVSQEDKLRHFRNVTSSVLQDSLDTWADIWNEMEDSVTSGHLVSPDVKEGFTPNCGWPEFLEKFWLLKHYLDYAKRYCDGKV